jgi:RHS repeat-associated protein
MPTDIGYTGQRLDATGLMYFQARYYAHYLNRWLSPDTIVPDPKNPQSLNRFSYVRNRPLNRIDPSGHQDRYDEGGGGSPPQSDFPRFSEIAGPLVVVVASFFYEPIDYASTAIQCVTAGCSPADVLLTLAPGSLSAMNKLADVFRAGENVGDAVKAVENTGETAQKSTGLLQAPGKIGDIPLYSLDDKASRSWYHSQLDSIPSQIDNSLPLRDQARQAFELRNQARQNARQLMSNRQLATDLDFTDPLPSWHQMLKRAASNGYEGEDVYLYILRSSTRSRASVDAALGLER